MTIPIPTPSINRKELEAKLRHVIGEYGAFNHMGVMEGNTVVLGVLTLFDQYAKDYASEIIGADETNEQANGLLPDRADRRNQLRFEQRAKLNQSNQEPQL